MACKSGRLQEALQHRHPRGCATQTRGPDGGADIAERGKRLSPLHGSPYPTASRTFLQWRKSGVASVGVFAAPLRVQISWRLQLVVYAAGCAGPQGARRRATTL